MKAISLPTRIRSSSSIARADNSGEARHNNTEQPLNIVIQTRPHISKSVPARSADFMLAIEALKRGHNVYATEPKDVFFKNGNLHAQLSKMQLTDTTEVIEKRRLEVVKNNDDNVPFSDFLSLNKPVDKSLHDVDIVLPRQDPPEDAEYITNLQFLKNALPPHVTVAPPPATILNASEKLAILNPAFKEHIPPTLVTSDPTRLKDFFEEHDKNIVVKPLYEAAGRGVVRIKPGDNPDQIIKKALDERKGEPLMAQKFLEGVTAGDKRVFFIDGNETGAIRRIPPAGSFKVALTTGGSSAPTELTEQDRAICNKVSSWLKENKIQFAGIDLIEDGKGKPSLIEINHTSPSGITPYERFTGKNLAPAIIDSIENYHKTRPPIQQ